MLEFKITWLMRGFTPEVVRAPNNENVKASTLAMALHQVADVIPEKATIEFVGVNVEQVDV